jgi:nucleotide-binding universal stress UspA family protein
MEINMKIIVPIDFSSESYSAAQYAAHLAESIDASVELFNVLQSAPPKEFMTAGQPVSNEIINEQNQELMIRNRRKLQELAKEYTKADIDFIYDVEMIEMKDINTAYERMIDNDVRYRFVIDMATL